MNHPARRGQQAHAWVIAPAAGTHATRAENLPVRARKRVLVEWTGAYGSAENTPYASAATVGATGRLRNDGVPSRNQEAIIVSKIMQPNEDVGMKGQMGLPQR